MSLKFLVFAALVGCAVAQSLSYLSERSVEINSDEHGGAPGRRKTSCKCGWANKAISRIVNGTETNKHEFPFAAGIVQLRNNFRFCGATIITEWHAITAAHCTEGENFRKLGLLVGEHDVTDKIVPPTEVIPLAAIVDHPAYDTHRITDDLSILVTSRKITFSNLVGPACLPTNQLQLARQQVKIIGWGAQVFEGDQSTVLRKVNVRVVPMDECNLVYRNVNHRVPKQICTYRTKRASCQGDSGGPVVWLDPETNRYTIVGAVSFGRVCGDYSPSVHTDIGAYLPWIQNAIRSTKPTSTCSKV